MGQGPGRVQEHGCGREQEPRSRYGHGYGTVQRPGMMQDTGKVHGYGTVQGPRRVQYTWKVQEHGKVQESGMPKVVRAWEWEGTSTGVWDGAGAWDGIGAMEEK